MDPNATLAEIRSLIGQVGNPVAAERLAELVEALDEWLSHGGFPPDEWTR